MVRGSGILTSSHKTASISFYTKYHLLNSLKTVITLYVVRILHESWKLVWSLLILILCYKTSSLIMFIKSFIIQTRKSGHAVRIRSPTDEHHQHLSDDKILNSYSVYGNVYIQPFCVQARYTCFKVGVVFSSAYRKCCIYSHVSHKVKLNTFRLALDISIVRRKRASTTVARTLNILWCSLCSTL